MPQYIQSLFNIRENTKNIRGKNKLVLPVAKTTTDGLKSTCYIAAKAWNAWPDNLRWFEIVSSTYILMGYYNHSLSLDATLMVSKNCPIIGEHVVIIFVTQ